MKVSINKESEDGRLTRCRRRMKGGELVRELRLSMKLVSFLFVHFLLVNMFFPIYSPLDSFYFISLFYGNNSIHIYIVNFLNLWNISDP